MRAELEESRRVTLAGCALVAGCQLAFGFIDLPLFGTTAAALDFAHAAVAAVMGLWLWIRGPTERGYEVAFTLLALLYLPVIFVSEIRGAELGLARDPLVPLQFLMVGIAVLAPGRTKVGVGLLALVCVSTFVFWFCLRSIHPVRGGDAEPGMTLVYAGIAATFLGLRVRRRAMIHQLATARAEADALARVARLLLAVRDRSNTPLQTLELSTALLSQRHPEAATLISRMNNAIARLRDLSVVYTATEAWQPTPVPLEADLAREVEEAARALEHAFENKD